MPITDEQKAAAIQLQQAAAHDENGKVRIIAGPGTGKSYTIEERVCWLLGRGIDPIAIYAISFTRASAADLRERIRAYCEGRNVAGGNHVRVSTLHSLALRILRLAGLLQAYPVSPVILDDWELKHILDAEYSETAGVKASRSQELRRQFEAYWSTGNWQPPNYIPADPPISEAERQSFRHFHQPRTQTYSCVLPGEVVRKCVTSIRNGLLNPVALLGIQQLIVDEYQDLNQCDVDFIDQLIHLGVTTFVAGDDDQSIYSFRFGSPEGIQSFVSRHPDATTHTLSECFRCTSRVVSAAADVMGHFPAPNRIPKNLVSLYDHAAPPETGTIHRWRFNDHNDELQAITASIAGLTRGGVPASEIMILLGNKRQLLSPVANALRVANISYDSPNAEGLLDTDGGRFALALLRHICNRDDYVAYRQLLGILPGVRTKTCNLIAEGTVAANLNYRQLFFVPLPDGVFTAKPLDALNRVRALCRQVQEWTANDLLNERRALLTELIRATLGGQEAEAWETATAGLPDGATIEELRDYVWADTDHQQAQLRESIFKRLEIAYNPEQLLPSKVRIMSMHGAKGLSARVVFMPGLEESLFPGTWRAPYPGLILEAARLFYVSLTRARATCVLSYCTRRLLFGKFANQTASRFLHHVGGPFADKGGGLTDQETEAIIASIGNL